EVVVPGLAPTHAVGQVDLAVSVRVHAGDCDAGQPVDSIHEQGVVRGVDVAAGVLQAGPAPARAGGGGRGRVAGGPVLRSSDADQVIQVDERRIRLVGNDPVHTGPRQGLQAVGAEVDAEVVAGAGGQ